jgi:hypothetical protein
VSAVVASAPGSRRRREVQPKTTKGVQQWLP